MRDERPLKNLPHIREFICGGGSAAINILITFPPNKLMFRQQLDGKNIVEAFYSIKNEGIRKLYRGVKPPLAQAAISKSLMFGLYSWYDRAIPECCGSFQGSHHAAAFMAGTTEAILTPFERVQTLLQAPNYNNKIKGAADALRYVNSYGLREHYRGLSAILLRNGPTNVCFFGLRQPLRELLPVGETTREHMLSNFVSGALLGACLSTLFFPINVAKTRMQSYCGGEYISTWKALCDVYNERGGSIRHIYRGVHINFTRSLVSWGIINSAYEILRSHL